MLVSKSPHLDRKHVNDYYHRITTTKIYIDFDQIIIKSTNEIKYLFTGFNIFDCFTYFSLEMVQINMEG